MLTLTNVVLGLVFGWATVLLGAAGDVGSQGIWIPFALLTIGVGIIGGLFKLSFSMGASSTKVNKSVESLEKAMTDLKEQLKAEQAERERDRTEQRNVMRDLQVSIEKLGNRINSVEVQLARQEGAAAAKSHDTAA